MRKIMSFSVAAILVLVATGWAMTASESRDTFTGPRINTFEMMSITVDLAGAAIRGVLSRHTRLPPLTPA
jgi:hypothetical protein